MKHEWHAMSEAARASKQATFLAVDRTHEESRFNADMRNRLPQAGLTFFPRPPPLWLCSWAHSSGPAPSEAALPAAAHHAPAPAHKPARNGGIRYLVGRALQVKLFLVFQRTVLRCSQAKPSI